MGDLPGNDESQKMNDSNRTANGSVTRHVGPTLEAEGLLEDVEGSALNTGKSGPDADSVDTLDVRTFGEDRAYQRASREVDELLAEGKDAELSDESAASPDEAFFGFSKQLGEVPEPLTTRLAGDTSSDPHTDLGPDNATTVQARPEGNQDNRNDR